jgi:hypothetical protein
MSSRPSSTSGSGPKQAKKPVDPRVQKIYNDLTDLALALLERNKPPEIKLQIPLNSNVCGQEAAVAIETSNRNGWMKVVPVSSNGTVLGEAHAFMTRLCRQAEEMADKAKIDAKLYDEGGAYDILGRALRDLFCTEEGRDELEGAGYITEGPVERNGNWFVRLVASSQTPRAKA